MLDRLWNDCPVIPLTINEWDEWGDPRNDPVMRAYLRSYSPYDNVPPPPWPDLLVTGNAHDTRVLIREPAKWVARLRATAASTEGLGWQTATTWVLGPRNCKNSMIILK